MVIGGGAAGMSAASAARRVAPELDVVVCEAGGFAAYGMCGIPYFLGGTVPRAENLLAYPLSEFRDHRGIDLRLHTTVSAIDASAHQVHLAGEAGSGPLGYDALVVATGASPVRPPVPDSTGPGSSRSGPWRTRSDCGASWRRARSAVPSWWEPGTSAWKPRRPWSARGSRSRSSRRCRGCSATSTSRSPGWPGRSWNGTPGCGSAPGWTPCARAGPRRSLKATVNGAEIGTDLVVIATGVRPATDLLIGAGAGHLADRSVLVDPGMRTSLPDVFAAGDCVALPHLVLGGPAWVPLGPAANKTGRVAGTVAAGGAASFPGIVGTAVVKVFDLEVARTGLTLAEAQAAGLAAAATDVVSRSRAKYYPGGSPLHVRLVHAPDGQLLGGQLAGREGAAKRIDVLATALHAGLAVADLAGLDLSYAPPFAPVYDPVLAAAIKAGSARSRHEWTASRRQHPRRTRMSLQSPRDKRVSLADAISLVSDGAMVALGGGLCARLPMAMVRELIRQGRRGLHLIGSAHSIDVDLLVATGAVRRCEESYVGFEQDLGLAPGYRRAAEAGTIEVAESCCATILAQLRAAEMGLPFLPVRGVRGSDIGRLHPEYAEITCPFTGETLVAVPALRPDVALLHAPAGDRYGNLHLEQPYVLDERFASASRLVVATVDEVVSTEEVARSGVTIPAHLVAAVAEVPYGAHPSSCYPRYAYDRDHLREYVSAAESGAR